MAYTPTEWKDHIVEHPNRYRVVDNGDGTVDILDEHGAVIQQGTPVDATHLNKIEQGIKDANDAIAAHLADFTQLETKTDNHISETALDDVHNLLSSGKIIEESGSNANGRYIRFADGTQICISNRIDISGQSVTAIGNVYFYAHPTIPYAASFSEIPAVMVEVGRTGGTAEESYGWGSVVSYGSTTGVAPLVFKPTNIDFSNAILFVVAIGRWK